MESSGDKGASDDPSRSRPDFHGDKAQQASLGSHRHEDEGKGFQSQPRTVQVQVEKPRY